MKFFLAGKLSLLCAVAAPAVAAPSVTGMYYLNCSGCHGLAGHGVPSHGIPDLAEAGRYVGSAAGRDYLERVPGVSLSRMNDADTARVLNWALVRFSTPKLAPGFVPFTASDVARGRLAPLSDAPARRAGLP